MKNLVKFEWHSIPFSSWIYKIASNEINTHFRKKRFWFLSLETLFEAPGFEVVEEVDLQEDYLQAQKQLERHEDFRQVRQLLKKLPSNYQEVLVLRFFEDKKIRGQVPTLYQFARPIRIDGDWPGQFTDFYSGRLW